MLVGIGQKRRENEGPAFTFSRAAITAFRNKARPQRIRHHSFRDTECRKTQPSTRTVQIGDITAFRGAHFQKPVRDRAQSCRNGGRQTGRCRCCGQFIMNCTCSSLSLRRNATARADSHHAGCQQKLITSFPRPICGHNRSGKLSFPRWPSAAYGRRNPERWGCSSAVWPKVWAAHRSCSGLWL